MPSLAVATHNNKKNCHFFFLISKTPFKGLSIEVVSICRCKNCLQRTIYMLPPVEEILGIRQPCSKTCLIYKNRTLLSISKVKGIWFCVKFDPVEKQFSPIRHNISSLQNELHFHKRIFLPL